MGAWRQLRRAVRDMDRRHLDLLLAAVVFVALEVELALRPLGDDRLLGHALGIPIFLGVLVRRRAPELGVALVLGAAAGYQRIPPVFYDGILPFFAMFLSTYALGAYLEGRRLLLGVGISLLMVGVVFVADPEDPPIGEFIASSAVLIGGPVLMGMTLRNRARTAHALEERARRADAEHARLAAEAVEEERTRIAGELHDVVAHALSAMVVQASAARRLAAANPQAAAGAFAAVEESGRDALTEIRTLLGVLRREDEDLALAPQPSLAHVGSLVGRVRASGLPVTLHVQGEPRPLPAGADLTAYRVVQEALGEAMEPGGAGAAEVRIEFSTAGVEVEVADDGPDPERPLLGMRERVALYGGELRAGARRRGGHVVRVRLPAGAGS